MKRIKFDNIPWYDIDAMINAYQTAANWFYDNGSHADFEMCDEAAEALTKIKNTLNCGLSAMDEAEML